MSTPISPNKNAPEEILERKNSEIPLEKPESANAAAGLAQTGLPFKLTGSQAKTAFALRKNCEDMIAGNAPKVLREVEYPCGTETRKTKIWVAEKAENLNCTGFLTLTVGDYHCADHGKQIPGKGEVCACPECGQKMKFVQIWDAAEANRRINNLNRRVIPEVFEKLILVSERHKSKAIHFHGCGLLLNRPDIRTGFDHDAVRNGDYLSASAELQKKWEFLRETLPLYGFGRAQLTPIEKTGEAIACYISKYIEKNLFNRLAEDKRKKLVRYIGWKGVLGHHDRVDKNLIWLPAGKKIGLQLKPNEFSWGTKRATAWRMKARSLAAEVHIYEKDMMKEAFGAKWACKITEIINRIDDKSVPFFTCGYDLKRLARKWLVKENPAWCKWREKQMNAEYWRGRKLFEQWQDEQQDALNDKHRMLVESLSEFSGN